MCLLFVNQTSQGDVKIIESEVIKWLNVYPHFVFAFDQFLIQFWLKTGSVFDRKFKTDEIPTKLFSLFETNTGWSLLYGRWSWKWKKKNSLTSKISKTKPPWKKN